MGEREVDNLVTAGGVMPSARAAVLAEYGVLDTPSEREFDEVVLLAAQLLQVPISTITLIDGDRQWFKARVGMPVAETPIGQSFCAFAVESSATLVVPDATLDARFATMANVTGDPNIRFYAGAPLINPEGVALGAICVIDSVPREITAEQQGALEALSRQVMAQLELRRASLRLLEVDRIRDDALALVAHELRNPVHSILAFAELLLDDEGDGSLDGWQRIAVESMEQSGRRLAVIAEDLLLLRQLETANLPLGFGPVDAGSVLERAVASASPVAGQKGVALRLELPPRPLPLTADPVRLGQAVDNLLGNAVKFTPEGGAVTVGLAGDRAGVVITVADTGPGIPPADLPHLFLPFYRLESARRSGAPGAGLGLAIARSIAERHGGSIDVASEVGRGTTFSIRLPAAG